METVNGIDVLLFLIALVTTAGWVASSRELRRRRFRDDNVLVQGRHVLGRADYYVGSAEAYLPVTRIHERVYDRAVDGL